MEFCSHKKVEGGGGVKCRGNLNMGARSFNHMDGSTTSFLPLKKGGAKTFNIEGGAKGLGHTIFPFCSPLRVINE